MDPLFCGGKGERMITLFFTFLYNVQENDLPHTLDSTDKSDCIFREFREIRRAEDPGEDHRTELFICLPGQRSDESIWHNHDIDFTDATEHLRRYAIEEDTRDDALDVCVNHNQPGMMFFCFFQDCTGDIRCYGLFECHTDSRIE